jgi:hypothetical protein
MKIKQLLYIAIDNNKTNILILINSTIVNMAFIDVK